MISARAYQERLAHMILARQGISAIWEMQLSAAAAYAAGHADTAELIVHVADVVEREILRRKTD